MATATVEKSEQVQSYERSLERLRGMLANKREERLHANSVEQSEKCDREIEQFAEAIAVYEDALAIEPKLTQFGSHKSAKWSTTVPPNLIEFRGRPGRVIQADYYRFQTSDPLQIATLRRLIAQGGMEGTLREMQPGLMPFIGPTGRFSRWGAAQDYVTDKAAGMLREW